MIRIFLGWSRRQVSPGTGRVRAATLFPCALALAISTAIAPSGAAAPAQTPATGAAAAANAASAPTPAEAQQVLAILQNPQKLAALIQTLQTIAKTAPATAATPAIALAPNSLGAQLLPQVPGWTGRIAAAAASTVAQLSEAPLLWHALMRMIGDPDARGAAADAGWRIVLVLLCAAAAELVTRLVLSRPVRSLEAHAPGPDHPRNAWESLRRLPFAAMRLVLQLIPVAALAGTGNAVAGIVGGTPAVALVGLAIVNAYAIGRAILCGGHMLASPDIPRLRLVPVGNDGAAAIMGWLRRIVFATVLGSAIAQIVVLLDLPQAAHDAVIRLTALAVAILLGAAVLHYRQAAASHIRGGAQDPKAVAEWRRWLAETWHYLALAAIVAAWLVAVGGAAHRLDTLDFLLGTVGVLTAAWLAAIVALGALARTLPHGPGDGRQRAAIGTHAARYYRTIRIAVISAITACAAVLLLQLWGADALAWFAPGAVGQHLLSALVTIALAAAFAIIVWESVNAALDRQVDRLHDAEPMRSARLRTLVPILRTTLLVTILVVVGATALSAVGVNIAPLLAGAGIVGIAVGFGAQTLVHDIITGMFILIENTIQVGDGVTVAGLTGTVEALSLRTLRLRAGDGSLHIIPFSSVVTVTNTNRGIGNAAVSVVVAPHQDIDQATAEIVAIGEELRADAEFAPMITGNLDVWGVDAISATGVTIAGKIPCTVAGKMPVQREFNRRVLKRFAETGIALAAPA